MHVTPNYFYLVLAFRFFSDGKTRIMDKIITSYDYPPIPIRNYDWSAIREDYEPGDLIGTGRSEQEAKDDLVRQENER